MSDDTDKPTYAWQDDFLPAKRLTRSYAPTVDRFEPEINVPLEPVPCEGKDALFFPEPSKYKTKVDREREVSAAKRLCGQCWMRTPCREYAMSHSEYGLWGGLTEEERARLKRRGSA